MAEHPGEVHSAAMLHRKLKIPAQYLRQLMTHLSDKGFISASRGRHGGFILKRDGHAIRIGEIIDAGGVNQACK